MRDTPIASRLFLLAGFGILALTAGSKPLWPVFVVASLALTAGIGYLSLVERPAISEVLFFAVLFRLLLLPLLPSLSDDGYRYVWDGMLQWGGINPFVFRPDALDLGGFQSAPVYGHLNSVGYYSVYPPVSQIIFFLGGWIPWHGWPLAFLIIKMAVIAAELTALFLLSRMASPRSLILYAWNPLVVVETAGQAHTEGLMVALLLAAIWAYRSGRKGLSVAALTGAVWVKLYPVLFLPFLLRRVGWRRFWIVVLVSLIIVTPYAAPGVLGNAIASLQLYVSYFEFYSAPYLILKALGYGLGWVHGVEASIGSALGLAFVCLAGWLYVEDGRRNWNLAMVLFMVMVCHMLTATTIHPWYFIPMLSLVPLVRLQRRAWLWLAACSTGTYLLYSHNVYWIFVWLGWGGWAILALNDASWSQTWLQKSLIRILVRRAKNKVELIRPHLDDDTGEDRRSMSVLDLGAGEGFVGQELEKQGDFSVTLCDTIPSNKTDLPFVVYDGLELPFGDKWFDATILVFTLHHCEDHVTVMREARRVTSGRIVIVESVFETELHRQIFDVIDGWVNRIRSGGMMNEYRHFRKVEDWVGLFEQMGFTIQSVRRWGRFHKQALIVLDG